MQDKLKNKRALLRQKIATSIVAVKLMGGFGNQMFQFAAALALALNHKAKLKLDLSFLMDQTPRPNFTHCDYELDAFFLVQDCEAFSDFGMLDQLSLQRHVETGLQFDSTFFRLPPNVYLEGYWQSWKYFEPIKEELYKAFTHRNDLNLDQQALSKQICSTVSVCVHIRRGDFIDNVIINAIHGVCNLGYYQSASDCISQRYPEAHFYVFSDDPDWCRSVPLLKGHPHTFVSEGNSVATDFQMMRLCRHFIIANISLSWWAAYLSNSEDKLVIAPEPWFDNLSLDTSDLLPESWIRLCKSPVQPVNDLKRRPCVSIIIPCYNQSGYLPEAVASVIAQTFSNWEIFIINDGSPDDTNRVAQHLINIYPKYRINLIEKPNGGVADARNIGIHAAHGRYILPLDADDKLHPQMLEKTVALLESDPNIDIVYTDLQQFGISNQLIRAADYDFSQLVRNNQLNYCSLYKREIWDTVGGYDPNICGYEDWDFWISCGKKGYIARRLPEPLFFYRVKEVSLFTEAFKRDSELRAQIILNHLELYDQTVVEWAKTILATSKSSIEEKGLETAMIIEPLVTVIIPTFNRPELLRDAIGSIIEQTYKNWDIVVVNDAGIDVKSLLLSLNQTQRIHYINQEHNRGPHAARNAGLVLAQGDIICFLDDDDRFLPNHFETVVSMLRQPEIELVYTDACYVQEVIENGQRRALAYDAPFRGIPYSRNRLLVENFIPINTWALRRKLALRVGPFAEDYTALEDWEFLLRLTALTEPKPIRQTTVEVRIRSNIGEHLSDREKVRFLPLFERIYEQHPSQSPEVQTGRRHRLVSLQNSSDYTMLNEYDDNFVSAAAPLIKTYSNQESLSIVFSTRKIDPQFIDHITSTIGIQNIEVVPYANPSEYSLTELYNRGLKASKHDIVIFIHDDIVFNHNNWGKVLIKQFRDTDYGILGVAGTTDLIKNDSRIAERWWAMGNRMVGRIRHETNGKRVDSFYSNHYNYPIQVVCLDGVFIAIDKSKIRKKFDERFNGFHYYDISFTFANHLAGVKVGVIFDIDLTHKSGGKPNQQWHQNKLLFSNIYGHLLPFGVKPERIEYDASTIRKFNPGNSLISIIILTKDKIDLLIDCIQSIIDHTHIARYEIIIADTGSTDENRKKLLDWVNLLGKKHNFHGIKVIQYDYYNFAKINNAVVKKHLSKKSNHVLFCNNDIKLLNDAVDRCLCLFKEKKNVGTVGIRLHYADRSIQHNGIELFFGMGKVMGATYRNIHSYYRYDRDIVEVSGNTAAFLMMERTIFERFYFNESYRECFEDVELNLQMLKIGRKNYQIGHAVAYHYESQTRNENPDKNEKVIEDYQNHLLPFFKQHCVPLFFAQLFEGASRASRVGQFKTAVEIGEMLLGDAPHHADVHHLLGVIYGRSGDQVRATQQIRQAIALNGAIPSYHYNLAEALRRQDHWQQAEQSYRQALRLAPNMVDANVNLAIVLKQQGRLQEALACCQQASRYDLDYVSAHCAMGDILRQLGAYEAAVECYQRVIQLQADWAEAYHYLGMVLSNLENRLDEAAQCYRQALQYNPNLIEARINLGKMLEQQGLIEDARSCYQQVPSWGADHALFWLRVESLCPPVLASRAAIDSYRDALWARLEQWRTPGDVQVDLKLLHASGFEPPQLIYQGRDDRPLKEAWAALFQSLLPEVQRLPSPRKRPHIGFVVTRHHESAFLKGMAGIVNQLSVDRFDLTVVCSEEGGEARLRIGIRHPDVRYLPLPDRLDHSVERLREARFAVLYHWEVGTDSINYFLPFFRLAPVQCTGWGWPVTSGIPQIDYYLSSESLETAGSDAHYSERLVRFQRLPTCYQRPELPETPLERERLGLATGQHLYLCTQNPRKIHPDFDELLAGLLRRDPCGMVVLVEDIQPAVTAALRQRWRTHLPDVIERVRFVPWLAHRDYLGLLAAADVALDTLHFGGGITAYDALAVGLPIVTLPGAFSRGRYSYAAYRQMGLDEGIATDPQDYIDRAVRFASEPDYRAAFSLQLREASAQLFEDQIAVREFEEFLETVLASL